MPVDFSRQRGEADLIYVPRIKIRQITPKAEENKFVRDAIDRGNMKVASIAKNIIAEYGVEPEEIRNAAISAYAKSRGLVSELNNLKTEIEDLEVKLNVLKKYREVKHYGEERERAECVYIQLLHGLDECSDEDE